MYNLRVNIQTMESVGEGRDGIRTEKIFYINKCEISDRFFFQWVVEYNKKRNSKGLLLNVARSICRPLLLSWKRAGFIWS